MELPLMKDKYLSLSFTLKKSRGHKYNIPLVTLFIAPNRLYKIRLYKEIFFFLDRLYTYIFYGCQIE